MNEQVLHLRITGRTSLPVCWPVNGPFTVERLTSDIAQVECRDCLTEESRRGVDDDISGENIQQLINKVTGQTGD